jgi:hypothetical protein
VGGDYDSAANHCRNAIYILISGAASTDTYTLEVKITYEIVPTTSYRTWSSTAGSRAVNGDTVNLKNII